MVENRHVLAPNRDSQKGSLPFQRASCLRSIIHDFARAIPRVTNLRRRIWTLFVSLIRATGTRKASQMPVCDTVNCNEAKSKTPDILKKSTAGCSAESLTDRAVLAGAKLRLAPRVSTNLRLLAAPKSGQLSVVPARDSYRSFFGVGPEISRFTALAVAFFAARRRVDPRTTSCGCNTTVSGLSGTFECRIASVRRAACSPISRLC